MSYGYVISKQDLSIIDVFTVTDYEIKHNLEYGGKSTVTVGRTPIIDEGDFLFLKTESGKIFYTGIVDSISNDSGSSEHTINLLEKESLFDRKIILDGKALIASTGIEDFIVKAIEDNFIDSGDDLLDLTYITVEATTHTPVNALVDTDNDIFNLKTYLGNALEYYGIFIDFEFTGSDLKISIYKKDQDTLKVDASVSDVTNYVEDYSVSVLAKLTQVWKIPDTEENGIITKVGTKTIRNFVLLKDRTISTDITDPNRAIGDINVIYTETETEAQATEEATKEFTNNSYSHSVTADIRRESDLYPEDEFYIGHTCEIKTKAYGVRTSIISEISYSMDSAFISVKFGKMPITLIEKLRKERK